MRIGIFGGSFDPVHVGHLWIAEAAMETLQLDQVRWIPAATSPLKQGGPVASEEDRLQMVRLAVSGCESHLVDDCEIKRGEISYTVDTLETLASENPDADFFLIIGADSLASFHKWYKPERILQLATLAVVGRGGEKPIDFSILDGLAEQESIEAIQRSEIKMPLIELSSSEIRSRIAERRRIRFRVPHAVEALIDAQKLYRSIS